VVGITRSALVCLLVAVVVSGGRAQGERQSEAQQLKEQYEARMSLMRAEFDAKLAALREELGGVREELGAVTTDRRDAALEDAVNVLMKQEETRRGIGDFSQTTLFDNTFNPALSLSADFIFAVSDKDDTFETLDQFRLRSVELGVFGRVDPHVAYFAVVHFDDGDVELEEAYGLWDEGMPDTFSLKGGRYNIDFGKVSPIHEHDLPFVDKPQVIQEYLGGALRGTGLELHHWFPVGDTNLIRWSAGIVNALDGDSHPVFGPLAGEEHHHGDEEGAEPFGERDAENFAFTGRVTALFELSDETTLQIGGSAAWSPEDRAFYELMSGSVVVEDLERLVLGGDVTLDWADPTSGESLVFSGEFLWSRADFAEEDDAGGAPMTMRNVSSIGFYAYAEWAFNRHWSIGASGGWFEHAEESSHSSWDIGAFVTWRIDEYNRLRLEGRHFDDPDEDYWGLMLQWTVILGSHGHGLGW